MKNLIESRLTKLEELSFIQLSALPNYTDVNLKDHGKSVTIATWKNTVNGSQIKIVIQAYRYLFFGLARMEAMGFVIDSAGNKRRLTREEIYEFT